MTTIAVDLFNGLMIGVVFGVLFLLLMNWYNQ